MVSPGVSNGQTAFRNTLMASLQYQGGAQAEFAAGGSIQQGSSAELPHLQRDFIGARKRVDGFVWNDLTAAFLPVGKNIRGGDLGEAPARPIRRKSSRSRLTSIGLSFLHKFQREYLIVRPDWTISPIFAKERWSSRKIRYYPGQGHSALAFAPPPGIALVNTSAAREGLKMVKRKACETYYTVLSRWQRRSE